MQRFNKIFLLPILALLGFILFISSCSSNTRSETKPQASGVPVTVGKAIQKTVPVQLRAIGNVEAYSTVSVKSMVAGELAQVNFKEGQDVKKGELLLVIDPRSYEAALNQARANLAKDVAQAKNADEEVRRYAFLLEKNYIAREQFDQVRTNAETLKASVQADEAAVKNAQVQLDYCYIRSPMKGRTGNLALKQGNIVKANDVPIFTINQITPIYATFSVPEQFLPEIKKYRAGENLSVDAVIPNDEAHPQQGRLTFIDNAVDPTTGTIKLKGTFANEEKRLWPGQFVNVVLTLTTQPNAILVPSQAVQTGQQGPYVFVVKPDLTVENRPVVVNRALNGETVISQGLQPGETVVTDGQLRLVPGARVEIKNPAEGVKPS